ncbi:hypothetical protein OHC33_003701 [Knufia fluminis]|uniref:F-box domain-containing protein n=1 Tax=Knufia fluminis TaxID=191047 RepID=A0AAN8I558_9EURO|nr:hypothetical protein OHC33_003701 [Knufia fluminis]
MDRPRWRADVPVPPLERTQYRRGYLGAKIRRSAQIGLTVGRPDVSNPATPGSLSTEGQNPAAPSLLGLPPELRLQIFELMSRDRASTEIPARRALVGPRSKEYPFSHFFHRRKTTAQNSRPYHIALQPTALNLILACQQLRTELCNFIGLNCVYRRRETSDVLQLPQPGWFGRVSCSIFRYLELNSEPDLRYRQRTWPKYLRLLSEDLPNLIYLKLYSTWHVRTTQGKSSTSCGSWHFCVLRHPNLHQLVHTAASGPTWESNEERRVHWLIAEQSVDCHEYHKRQGRMEKWLDPARSSGRSVFEDHILNDKVIRRTLYQELLSPDLARFRISSDVPLPHGLRGRDMIRDVAYGEKVDERGLQTDEVFAARGWTFQTVDSIINEGRRIEERVRRVGVTASGPTTVGCAYEHDRATARRNGGSLEGRLSERRDQAEEGTKQPKGGGSGVGGKQIPGKD